MYVKIKTTVLNMKRASSLEEKKHRQQRTI